MTHNKRTKPVWLPFGGGWFFILIAMVLPGAPAPALADAFAGPSPNFTQHAPAPPKRPAIEKIAVVSANYSTPLQQVWQAIIAEADIPFVEIEVLQGRRRRMFSDGFLTLDCCVNPAWRNRPEEQTSQLFTDSFYTTEIRYIFKKGAVVPVPSPEHLRSLRFAKVRGFTYSLEDYFGETIAAKSIDDAFRLVEFGRAQLTEASRIQFEHEIARHPRDLEMGDVSNYTNLHIRVHISRAHLLPRLNAAIARMKASGRINQIVKDALANNQSPTRQP